MTKDKGTEFSIPTIGRAAFMGQLYNARNDQLINKNAFPNAKEISVKNSETKVTYTDVSKFSERARALDIHGELSLSILGGLVSLSGSGSYLDTSVDGISSREVSLVCSIRNGTKRIDLDIGSLSSLQYNTFRKEFDATHVITAIVYGGRLVANFKESKSDSQSAKDATGKLSAATLADLAGLFSVSTNADLKHKAADRVKAMDIEFKLFGDYHSEQSKVPTSVEEVFDLVGKWSQVIGAGVPIEITLTPLSRFVDTTPIGITFQRMRVEDTIAVQAVYDRLIGLECQRQRLLVSSEKSATLFPSIQAKCRERSHQVNMMVARARSDLAIFLEALRSGTVSGMMSVESFLQQYDATLIKEESLYKKDHSESRLLEHIHSRASSHGAPMASVEDLANSLDSGSHVAIVLVPPFPKIVQMQNMFVSMEKIREWRDRQIVHSDSRANEASSPSQKVKTLFRTLSKAVDDCKQENAAILVHYSPVIVNGMTIRWDWHILNDNGWGFIHEDTGAYYIGEVFNNKPHGYGTMTYVDGSKYIGQLWNCQRHGMGEVIETGESESKSGVFINDRLRNDGKMVDLRVYANHNLVGYHKIPLRTSDAVESHVDAIASITGWKPDECFRITVEGAGADNQAVEVAGHKVRFSQDPRIRLARWPLESLGCGDVIRVRADRL